MDFVQYGNVGEQWSCTTELKFFEGALYQRWQGSTGGCQYIKVPEMTEEEAKQITD